MRYSIVDRYLHKVTNKIKQVVETPGYFKTYILDGAGRNSDLSPNPLPNKYLIPIKIRAPLIFAHLACAKCKGSKFAQYESAKIKGKRKNATNE